ncbi:MAG: winged helix DNA-binding domain-containing protein [Candidatus Limnocylindrales bacterium]
MQPERSLRELNRATLERQALLERARGSVADIVGHLAGLQAQHADSPYIALWSRRADQTIADLESALNDRTVVKATVMRSTLHLVAATDYPVFDVASAEARIVNWRPTARRNGLDLERLHDALLAYCDEPRSVADIEGHLARVVGGRPAATPVGVRNVVFRMASAAGGLVHVPPSGLWHSHGKPRYVDARRWLRNDGQAGRDAALRDAALREAIARYLRAYGPASLEDIAKWVGQPRTARVRAAVDRLGERVFWSVGPAARPLVDLVDAPEPDPDRPAPPRFLSRWDSVLIAYASRDRILPTKYRDDVIRKNGDFLPTFIVDGFVAGLWSAEVKGGAATLHLTPFSMIPAAERRALEAEAERLVRYVEPEADRHAVTWAA